MFDTRLYRSMSVLELSIDIFKINKLYQVLRKAVLIKIPMPAPHLGESIQSTKIESSEISMTFNSDRSRPS